MLRSKGFSVVGGTVSFMKLVTAWAILIVYLVGLVGMMNMHWWSASRNGGCGWASWNMIDKLIAEHLQERGEWRMGLIVRI